MGDIININDKLSAKRQRDLHIVKPDYEEYEIAADLVYQQCIDDLLKCLRDNNVVIDENTIFDSDFEGVKNNLRYTINRQFGLKK